MNDEKYVFIEDVKERKSIARGAFHKKGGAKSKKCTLPSDYLTRKEREKMNREVKSWNLNKFYSWDEFKEMPSDIAAAYISTLNQKHHVSMSTIAKELFNIADSTFSVHLHKHGIFNLLNVKRYSNNSSTVEKFKNAMKKEKETTSTDIFIPDGMAPGYTSDGKKVEDAIKEAVGAVNKKLIEDSSISLGEAIADIHKEIGVPDTESALDFSYNPDGEFINLPYTLPKPGEFKKIDDPPKKNWKEELDSHSPVTRLNVTMDGIDMKRISDILSWFTGKDVMVTLIVNEKIGPDDLV